MQSALGSASSALKGQKPAPSTKLSPTINFTIGAIPESPLVGNAPNVVPSQQVPHLSQGTSTTVNNASLFLQIGLIVTLALLAWFAFRRS